jgi:hypothetical protein
MRQHTSAYTCSPGVQLEAQKPTDSLCPQEARDCLLQEARERLLLGGGGRDSPLQAARDCLFAQMLLWPQAAREGLLQTRCIRQHTSAYVSIRREKGLFFRRDDTFFSFLQAACDCLCPYIPTQHTSSAYVSILSIREHTCAYVSIREHTPASHNVAYDRAQGAEQCVSHQHTSAYVSIRQHTSACVSIREHTPASRNVEYDRAQGAEQCVAHKVPKAVAVARLPAIRHSIRQHTSSYVSIRQHTSAYVSIRQHTSAYVSVCQHMSAYNVSLISCPKPSPSHASPPHTRVP